jgi:hypothetical protein
MLFAGKGGEEQYIIELYKQGKTIREITHEVYISFGPISAIIRKFNGQNENDKEEKSNLPSKNTQAFKLFSEGKKPVIELDMKADEMSNLYQQFWRIDIAYYHHS